MHEEIRPKPITTKLAKIYLAKSSPRLTSGNQLTNSTGITTNQNRRTQNTNRTFVTSFIPPNY